MRVLRTGRLRPGGFQHDLAVGAGAVWVLDNGTPAGARLVRLAPGTGRRTGSVGVPGIADAVVVRGREVWVATAGAGHDVLRYDARTLRRTLLVHVD
jgi:hypothetical protein